MARQYKKVAGKCKAFKGGVKNPQIPIKNAGGSKDQPAQENCEESREESRGQEGGDEKAGDQESGAQKIDPHEGRQEVRRGRFDLSSPTGLVAQWLMPKPTFLGISSR